MNLFNTKKELVHAKLLPADLVVPVPVQQVEHFLLPLVVVGSIHGIYLAGEFFERHKAVAVLNSRLQEICSLPRQIKRGQTAK